MIFFLITFFTTFLRLACFSLALNFAFRAFILRSAAMACSSFDSLRFSFFASFLAALPAFFAAFFPAFFARFTFAAIFFFRAAILRRAALCSLLPLYLLILRLRARIAFSSFDSFFFSFFAF